MKVTADAAAFVEKITFDAIPAEALRIGTRCLLDGLGLFVAGSEEHTVQLLVEEAEQMGGRADALLLSRGNVKVPAPMAARVLGTAGHAHDWDDSQVSVDPAHVYGSVDPSDDSAAEQRAGDGAEARRHRRQDFHARLPHRFRSRVQNLRVDAAAALSARLPLQRHGRHLRRLRRGGKATWD